MFCSFDDMQILHKKTDRKVISRQDGFTLIEVLLAVFILAMVVGMVSVSLSSSLRLVDGAMKNGEVYYRAQVAMELLANDLSNAFSRQYKDFASPGVTNGDDLLSFVSTNDIDFTGSGRSNSLVKVSYKVVPEHDADDSYVLLRAEKIVKPQSGNSGFNKEDYFLVSDRLKKVEFVFINSDGEEFSEWDAQEQTNNTGKKVFLPSAVKYTLSFWLDQEQTSSFDFSTKVFLPDGLLP